MVSELSCLQGLLRSVGIELGKTLRRQGYREKLARNRAHVDRRTHSERPETRLQREA